MAELKNIRIAVSGIYDYALEELPSLRVPMPGRGAPEWVEEKRIYKVYRPAETLRKACDKFKLLPLTHHHPQAPVSETNFRDLAIGYTGENPFIDYIAEKDEVGIRSNVVLSDQEAINAYNRGEIQLSPGYVAEFEWKKGTDPHGNAYDIVMKEITDVNHLALLPAGRGGSYAVVLDEAPKRETIFDIVSTKDGAPMGNDNASKDHKKENKLLRTSLGKTEKWFIDIAKKCGFDFSEYEHETTNHFENHVIKEHGKGNEHDPANIPIENKDFSKIKEIISNPDYIVFGVKRDGEDRIIYAKTFNDNTTIYFEEILSGKKNKKLRGKTMFKRNEKVSSEKLKKMLNSNKHNDTSNIKIACSEVTDSSINRYKNDVGGQLQQQAGSNYIIIDTTPKVKSIFERVQGSVFDRYRK